MLTGCAAPKGEFQAKKDPTCHGKVERLLIVYRNGPETDRYLGDHFSETLLNRMVGELAQRGVVSEVVQPNYEVTDSLAPVRAATSRFLPRQRMNFALARTFRSEHGYRATPGSLVHVQSDATLKFRFDLSDAESGQIFWRGELNDNTLLAPQSIADQFVEQLTTENF